MMGKHHTSHEISLVFYKNQTKVKSSLIKKLNSPKKLNQFRCQTAKLFNLIFAEATKTFPRWLINM